MYAKIKNEEKLQQQTCALTMQLLNQNNLIKIFFHRELST